MRAMPPSVQSLCQQLQSLAQQGFTGALAVRFHNGGVTEAKATIDLAVAPVVVAALENTMYVPINAQPAREISDKFEMRHRMP